MTAIGFALLLIGAAAAAYFQEHGTKETYFLASIFVAVFGLLCILGGVTIWLWRFMP